MEATQTHIPDNLTGRITIVIGKQQFTGNWHEENWGTRLDRFKEVGFIAQKAPRDDKVILIFPEGWKSVISPASNWTSCLYDEKGQFRGTIDFSDYFGKKTYDIRPASKITLCRKYDIYCKGGIYDVREYPGENILFTPTIPEDTPCHQIFCIQNQMCMEYLNANFPDWKDPFSYW